MVGTVFQRDALSLQMLGGFFKTTFKKVLTLSICGRNVLHDPKLYPEPSVFRPERFIPDKHGNVARDPGVNGAFGFGRRCVLLFLHFQKRAAIRGLGFLFRICAGRNLAEASIWIAVASLLAVYDIRPALDKDGKPVDVSHAFDGEAGLFK